MPARKPWIFGAALLSFETPRNPTRTDRLSCASSELGLANKVSAAAPSTPLRSMRAPPGAHYPIRAFLLIPHTLEIKDFAGDPGGLRENVAMRSLRAQAAITAATVFPLVLVLRFAGALERLELGVYDLA